MGKKLLLAISIIGIVFATGQIKPEAKTEEKKLIGKFGIKTKPPYKIGDIIGYSEPNLPERYVGRVVVAANWGNVYVADDDWNLTLERKEKEPKEIGYVICAKGDPQYEYRLGPENIVIDSKQNIYINDAVDKEVHKYNPQGIYLQTIKYEFEFRSKITLDLLTDELYVYDGAREKNVFKCYGQDGELKGTYRFREDIDLSGGIYIYDGHIRRISNGEEVFKIDIPRKKGIKIEENKKFVLPSRDKESDPTNISNAFLTIPSGVTKKGERERIKKRILLTLPEKYSEAYQANICFITENAVFAVFAIPVNPWQYIMAKYDKDNGRLLAIIDLKDEEDQYMKGAGGKKIDSKNNVYQLWTTKEGVYVIKWSKLGD